MSSSQNLLVPFMRCMALGASRFPSSNTLTPAYRLESRARRRAEGQELLNGPAVPPQSLSLS
jgi:hypothetical protein